MLSKRIAEIVELIPQDSIVADIGCDHAYLCITLMQQQRVKKCYAMDVAKGPLQQAVATIDKFGYPIDTILSDGLQNLPEDVDTVVIAGMGWITIRDILEHDYQKALRLKQIVIQPNRDVDDARSWIAAHQGKILDELFIKDGKYYQVICFTLNESEEYDERQLYFGPKLLLKKGELFTQYYTKRLAKLSSIVDGTTNEADHQRIAREIELIEKEFTSLK